MLFSYQVLILAHSIGALTVSSTEQGYGEVINSCVVSGLKKSQLDLFLE